MEHDDRPLPWVIRKAQADRLALDLILHCERAASRGNRRDCDPARWSRTAWRRYLYAAAHAPSVAPLRRIYGPLGVNLSLRKRLSGVWTNTRCDCNRP